LAPLDTTGEIPAWAPQITKVVMTRASPRAGEIGDDQRVAC